VQFDKVKIVYRNFAGAETMYNRAGDRNFSIVIPTDEMAEQLRADGWKVKTKPSRLDPDAVFHTLPVVVSYKGRPPRANLITSRGRTPLDENTIAIIDMAEIIDCDVIISPYNWTVNGNSGVKAYLHAIYVKVLEDELELRYADTPIAGAPQPRAQIGAAPDSVVIQGEVVADPWMTGETPF